MPHSSPDHLRHVSQWLDRTAKGASREQLSQLLESAVNALWRRADPMLGEATLTAIMKRVLHYSTEKYPFFESIEIHPGGIEFGASATAVEDELRDGMRFMLVEFMSIVGNLTADVLSAALHSELSKFSTDAAGAPGRGSR